MRPYIRVWNFFLNVKVACLASFIYFNAWNAGSCVLRGKRVHEWVNVNADVIHLYWWLDAAHAAPLKIKSIGGFLPQQTGAAKGPCA